MAVITQIYKQPFIEKIETLLPEHYQLNTYYQNFNNSSQYIMRNSKGYFHIMEIIKTKYGYTFNHYRIDKNEMMVDTGNHYGYYQSITDIRKSIEQEEKENE